MDQDNNVLINSPQTGIKLSFIKILGVIILLLLYGVGAYTLGRNSITPSIQSIPVPTEGQSKSTSKVSKTYISVTQIPSQNSPRILQTNEIYKNTKLNLAFQSPGPLEIEESDNLIALLSKENNEDDFGISISRKDNPKGYNLEQYVQEEFCNPFGDSPPSQLQGFKEQCYKAFQNTKKDYITNNINGIRFEYNSYELPSDTILFENKGYIYNWSTSSIEGAGADVPQKGKDTTDQILTTIEFIE